jgi:hypothetical protein
MAAQHWWQLSAQLVSLQALPYVIQQCEKKS